MKKNSFAAIGTEKSKGIIVILQYRSHIKMTIYIYTMENKEYIIIFLVTTYIIKISLYMIYRSIMPIIISRYMNVASFA